MNTSRRRARARALPMDTRQATLRRAARVWLLAALLIAYVVLAACGGGGDSTATAGGTGSNPQAPSPPSLSASQQSAAEKVYAGTPRTPADFFTDPPPAGVTGSVATVHLKSTDSTPGTASHFELCSDDLAQSLAWSEAKTAALATYADLVDTTSSAHLFEFVRVPRNDAASRIRHRVYRCSYIDRSATELTSENGAAGTLNLRPIDAAVLKDLAEYLWQFTTFNNADIVVLQSAAASAGPAELAHAIDMARLTRGATVTDCDRVELLRWTHTVNTGSGALRRQLDTLSSFGTRRANGSVTACTP